MKIEKSLIYLIGIKGVGMTALAVYLKQAGYEVTGSDSNQSFATDKILKQNGIHYFENFDAKNLKGLKPQTVVVSAAYGKENPEVAVAKNRHLNLKYYSEMLGQISSGKKVIAVAGVHGKTTTTAMVAYLLEKANLSPSFIIGAGKITGLSANAHKGSGDYFVVEADEYRKSPEDNAPKFLDLSPFISVISAIELDHPDIYGSLEEIYDAFYKFACRIPRSGLIILNFDYPKSKKLRQSLADRNFATYGYESGAKWKIINVQEGPALNEFYLEEAGKIHGPFRIKLPGKHNILNATAAIITALTSEIPEPTIKKYLSQFGGVERRFQKIAELKNLSIYDDYAHHPTAIKYTLEAARRKFPNKKIWCVFQPHTYSRTEKLLEEFSQAFKNADKVIITDIYASAREKGGKISALDLAAAIKNHQSGVRFMQNKEKIKDYIQDSLKGETVLITMGAGDIYKLGRDLADEMGEKNQNG